MRYKHYRDGSGEISEYILSIDESEIETFIPNDEANYDWQQYQAWLLEGNEPEEAD